MNGRGSGITIRSINPNTIVDVRELLTKPPHGWCWCVAWEVPTWEKWTSRTEEENRTLREELWAKGEYHGYVLYVDEIPVAWCRVGPRTTWPKLCQMFRLDSAKAVYSFVCFGIRGDYAGRGLMHEFMRLVLDDLAQRGVRYVEGFPRKIAARVPPGEGWLGPLSLFERAGFEKIDETERSFHVMKCLD